MSTPLNLDLQAKAELLAYLVLSQLLARALTGEWLSPLHTAESTGLWLLSNSGGADLIDRVRLSSCALELARRVAERTPTAQNRSVAASLIREKLRIDFRVPIAREIYQACIDHLVDMGWI